MSESTETQGTETLGGFNAATKDRLRRKIYFQSNKTQTFVGSKDKQLFYLTGKQQLFESKIQPAPTERLGETLTTTGFLGIRNSEAKTETGGNQPVNESGKGDFSER